MTKDSWVGEHLDFRLNVFVASIKARFSCLLHQLANTKYYVCGLLARAKSTLRFLIKIFDELLLSVEDKFCYNFSCNT